MHTEPFLPRPKATRPTMIPGCSISKAAELSGVSAKIIRHRSISELQGMRDALHDLVRQCGGDAAPDCPIIDELARDERAIPRRAHG